MSGEKKGELQGPAFEFLLYERLLASPMVNANMTLCSSLQNYELAQIFLYMDGSNPVSQLSSDRLGLLVNELFCL